MKQTKKSVYDMYPTMISSLEKKITKTLGSKVNPRHHLGWMLQENPGIDAEFEVSIYIEEHYWALNGRNVIFPESGDVIDNLMRARYEMESAEGFSLPFSSLVVAMPNGYTSGGYQMPGFLASYARNDCPHEKVFPFFDSMNASKDNIHYELKNDPTNVLVIQYRAPSDGAHGKVSIVAEDMPRLLKCRNAAEFGSEMAKFTNVLKGEVDAIGEDLEIQFFAIKLVAAIGVYNMATEGSRLKDGFPGSAMPKMMHYNDKGRLRLSTIKSAARAPKAQPDTHYRTWYFRQLRASRYYQGMYQEMAPGSRYVFVSDAVINQQVEASTLV